MGLLDKVKGMFSGAHKSASDMASSASDMTGNVADKVNDAASGAFDAVKDAASDPAGAVSNVASSATEMAGNVADKALDAVEDLAEKTPFNQDNQVVEKARTMVDNFTGGPAESNDAPAPEAPAEDSQPAMDGNAQPQDTPNQNEEDKSL